MIFAECVKSRRSIRKYKEEPVKKADFEQAVELASCAPSWKNTQIARYILVEDKALKEKLANECVMGFAYNSDTMKNAPALVVLTMIKERSGYERDGTFSTSKKDGWEMFDAGIAAQTFCLAAHSLGLGTVILGIFDEDKVHETAGVPENQKVAALIAIGYPDEQPNMPKRKSVEELASYR